MALLNLKKEDSPEDVPDKLPSLKQDEPKASPVEQPKPAQLAPDELPPLIIPKEVPKEQPRPEETSAIPAPKPAAVPEVPSGLADERLYFAQLISRFHADSLAKVSDPISGDQVLAAIRQHYERDQQKTRLEEKNRQAGELLAPLKALEQDWRALQAEILAFERQVKEKRGRLASCEQEIGEKANALGMVLDGREALAQLLR